MLCTLLKYTSQYFIYINVESSSIQTLLRLLSPHIVFTLRSQLNITYKFPVCGKVRVNTWTQLKSVLVKPWNPAERTWLSRTVVDFRHCNIRPGCKGSAACSSRSQSSLGRSFRELFLRQGGEHALEALWRCFSGSRSTRSGCCCAGISPEFPGGKLFSVVRMLFYEIAVGAYETVC